MPDKEPWDPWKDNDEPEELLMPQAQPWVWVASSGIILSLPQALAVLIPNSFLFFFQGQKSTAMIFFTYNSI